MNIYEVKYFLSVTVVCEVEAESADDALNIAQFEPWDYTDEQVEDYEVRVLSAIPKGGQDEPSV